jgi:formyltetrahydrofolate-dependent phosphoribosylglycinamide formyltransferase
MAKEGTPFIGVLYAGFIMTPKDGPVVLEYNCRFGDPETQVLLPLLKSDLYEIMAACVAGRLDQQNIEWHDGFACTVVCAAPGYPESYPKGAVIQGLKEASLLKDTKVFHAGAKNNGETVVTNGGRVLAVSGKGKTLQAAVDQAYQGVKQVSFDGMHYRKDIAKRGLNKKIRIGVLGSTRGSSLQPVIDAIAAKQLNAEIVVVVSNKADSGILERGKAHQIPSVCIPSTKDQKREDYDALVCQEMDKHGVELVLMIGFMRIVSKVFCDHFRNRCLNVHPSLLPDFAGGMDLEVHKAVLEAKKKLSGCTVHFVTEDVDGGQIAVQLTCPVEENDTPDTLKAKVQPLEGRAFIQAIQMFAQGKFNYLTQESITYRAAGVDIDAGEALVEAIKPMCKKTRRTGCDAELGGFGGLFDLSQAGYDSNETILVSGTDGVGTKLKIAQVTGKHKTIGIDLVAMCVNDVVVCGAEPLFFLDYYATGALNVAEAADVVNGIAEGCLQSGSALIGGETAEMAGMYAKGEYDLAGFSVGAVRRSQILPRNIQAGDILIGLPSSGVHSNGYSLVRKLVEKSGCPWDGPVPFQSEEKTLADALLIPTKIYVKELLPFIKCEKIKGLAHITGGGLLDNLPRVLPEDLTAVVNFNTNEWRLPPVFEWLQSLANLSQTELLRTFNCGMGMIVVVSKENAAELLKGFQGEETLTFGGNRRPVIIGELQKRERADQPQVAVIGNIC